MGAIAAGIAMFGAAIGGGIGDGIVIAKCLKVWLVNLNYQVN